MRRSFSCDARFGGQLCHRQSGQVQASAGGHPAGVKYSGRREEDEINYGISILFFLYFDVELVWLDSNVVLLSGQNVMTCTQSLLQ